MRTDERSEFIKDFLKDHIYPVLETKGVEYSQGQEDCNSNFKRGAEELGLTPQQVLKVYLNKHLDSISYAIKMNEYFKGSEPIYGRIGDAVNYLLILASLIYEGSDEYKKKVEQRAQEKIERVLAAEEAGLGIATAYTGRD